MKSKKCGPFGPRDCSIGCDLLYVKYRSDFEDWLRLPRCHPALGCSTRSSLLPSESSFITFRAASSDSARKIVMPNEQQQRTAPVPLLRVTASSLCAAHCLRQAPIGCRNCDYRNLDLVKNCFVVSHKYGTIPPRFLGYSEPAAAVFNLITPSPF